MRNAALTTATFLLFALAGCAPDSIVSPPTPKQNATSSRAIFIWASTTNYSHPDEVSGGVVRVSPSTTTADNCPWNADMGATIGGVSAQGREIGCTWVEALGGTLSLNAISYTNLPYCRFNGYTLSIDDGSKIYITSRTFSSADYNGLYEIQGRYTCD
jgi:hypothetical protein